MEDKYLHHTMSAKANEGKEEAARKLQFNQCLGVGDLLRANGAVSVHKQRGDSQQRKVVLIKARGVCCPSVVQLSRS